MKKFLFVLLALPLSVMEDGVTTKLDWKPACDGSSIEVISDLQKILSIRASAFHSEIIKEWSIHYSRKMT